MARRNKDIEKREELKEKSKEKKAQKSSKGKDYFDFLEDAREIRKLKKDLKTLRNEELKLAENGDFSKAREKSDKLVKKRKKRARLIKDFTKKYLELKGKVNRSELKQIEDFAFSDKL